MPGRWVAAAAFAATLGAVPALASDDPRFDDRWARLTAGGYEPLTIPLDFYDATAPIAGDLTPVEATTPKAAGVSPAALAAAASWAQAQNSIALIIARDGKVLFERYWQGSGRDTRFNPQSMSKTVLGLVFGSAVARGEIASADAPVARYVREWRNDRRGRIPLSALLHMAAGVGQGDGGFGYAVTPENPLVRHSLGSDFTRLPLALPLAGPAEAAFDYNNQVTQLLAIVLERASGKRYPELVSERVWRPLGLAPAAMPLDRPGGMALASCCILSRPVDWVRIGQLFVEGGSHGGRAIVPESWITAMTTPSPAYRGYGYQVWIGDQKVGGTPEPRPLLVPWQSETFTAPRMILLNGHGMQRVYAMPDKRLVIVRAARDWPSAWDDAVLPNTIWRGTTP